MNTQLQTLLFDSLNHYKGRQLKRALNTAQIALEFGLHEGFEYLGLVKANLLLARIYNTNGRFQNEPSFFQKALYYIAEAKRQNELFNDPVAGMEIALVSGKIYLNLRDFLRAEENIHVSLDRARHLDHKYGIVMSLGTLCAIAVGRNKLDYGIKLGEEALLFLKEQKRSPDHTDLLNEIHLRLSEAYMKKQKYSRALEVSQELLRLSRETGDVEKEVVALRNIAIICGVKSNYKIGMQYFLEALDKCRSIGYHELTVQLQVNISTLYAQLCNYQEAIRRYRQILDEHEKVLDENTKVIVHNNLGNILLTTEEPEKALEHFKKALKLIETYQLTTLRVHLLSQLSRCHLELNRLTDAKQDALFAQEIIDQESDLDGRQINLINLGEIAFREKNYNNALQFTERGILAARSLHDQSCEIRGYKLLSRIYKATKNFEKALTCQEKLTEIQDTFAREQRKRLSENI